MNHEDTHDFPKSDDVIMYGHRTCPMVPPVITMLKQSSVKFEYIDIHKQENSIGRAHVRAINNGNESVPTLVFPDGTTLTEPSPALLNKKLITLGYQVPVTARVSAFVLANLPWIIMAVLLIIGLLR